MKKLKLLPIKNISGEIQIPGSKSLSNRILLLSALSQGTTTINNVLDSDDVNYMVSALKKLGLSVNYDKENKKCIIDGVGGVFPQQNKTLYLGNAGTAMRPLTAALSLGHGEFTLEGDPRMYERPIKHLTDALEKLAVDIEFIKNDGFPPLKIIANGLNKSNIDEVQIRGDISSQYLTALLMSAPYAKNPFKIKIQGELVSKPYIDITLDVIKRFGVIIENRNYQEFIVKPSLYKSPNNIQIEGDASSASYFLAAGLINNSTVRVYGVGKNSVQGDIKFTEVLEAMGGKIILEEEYVEIQGRNGELKAIDMDLNHIPDAAMTIATTALFANGTTTIRNIENWRVKECDRLSAMATELRKVGAEVEEGQDYISITPPKVIKPAEIETYDDHRMAMCFALAAFGTAEITILDPDCVSKTFPTFFKDFIGLINE